MTEQDKHTNIAVGMRVKLRDSDYPGHGTVTMLHPPDDRPAYTGQTWFEVRWDDWDGDEGADADHRDTDLAPIVESEQPIDLSRRGLVKHISGLDDETIDRLGGVEPEQPRSVQRRIAEQMQGDDWPLNHKAGYEPETMARVRQIIEDFWKGDTPLRLRDLLAELDEGASNE